MPKNNTAVMIPKDFNTVVPNYNFRQVIDQDSAIAAKIWPGVFFRDSIFRSDNVFLLDADTQMKTTSEQTARMENFGDYAYLGRLYARDNEGYLRQIQMKIEDPENPEFIISAPVTIPEPTAPSFLTKLFAFFGHKASKRLIQTYNEQTAFAASLIQLEGRLDLGINLHPAQEVLDAAAKVDEEPEVIHIIDNSGDLEDSVDNEYSQIVLPNDFDQNPDNVHIPEEPNQNLQDTGSKKLTEAEKFDFFQDLTKASKFTAQDVQTELDDAFFDAQGYAKALTNLLIAQAAQLMLGAKNLNLNAAKPIFEGLQKSAEAFVYNTYNDEMHEIINMKMIQGNDQGATEKSNELVDKVNRTGLNHLLSYMNKDEKNQNMNFEEVTQNIQQAIKESASHPSRK